MANPLITLTTDFGTSDGYVGAVKGVILSINPKARIVDLSNEIPSYDIVVGSFHLGCAFPFYPKGTIHLAVVDPGVGSKRHPIVVKTKNYLFVGPDNGLFTLPTLRDPILGVYELTEKQFFRSEMSSTFHARDLFGPVAAHLSRGVKPAEFGRRLPSIKTCEEFRVRRVPNGWKGEVLFFDKFGNAFSNLHRGTVGDPAKYKVFLGLKPLKLYRTYSEIPPGRPGALFGSSGFLEIALREDSFEEHSKVARGDIIRLVASS